MQDDMYREYVDRIERIHDDKLMYESNIRQLEDFSMSFNSLDSVMNGLMEELVLTNREDNSFMRELFDINIEFQEARVSVGNNIKYKYEEFINEITQLEELEQQIEHEYREYVNEYQDNVYGE